MLIHCPNLQLQYKVVEGNERERFAEDEEKEREKDVERENLEGPLENIRDSN